jgi:hypothetical protein
MRKFSLPAACLAVLLGVPAATPALAFGHGCGWGAVECYDKVRLPDVYAVRTRPVLLSPAWREVFPTPPIVRNYAVPVEVRPGRWRTHVHPPVYGMKVQRVLVAPERRTVEEIPAVTRSVRKTVVVSPGGFRWQHRRGLFGHERLCKVRVAPVMRTVVREVVPTPPIVRNYAVPVEVRPGRWRTHVHPPVYGMRLQRVLVAPERRTVEEIPAVTRRVSKTVVVSPGGFRWQHRRGLFGHERLCKVRVAPVTRTVVSEVVVSPARRVAHVRPPIYRKVLRPALIRPATAERVYEPPVHAVLNRPVVVRPAGVQIFDHPPVVGVAQERVLVHEGGYAWKPSRRLFGRW